jgi:hypothetical protein
MSIISSIVNRVGAVTGADGTSQQSRAGKTGEQIVSQAHGKYYEGASRGNVYSACVPAATGVAPGTALGATAAFALQNPKGSGKRLAIKKVSAGYVSGTLGAGAVFHCANTNPAAAQVTGGTAVTPTNNDLGAANNSVAVCQFNTTLPATPTALYPFCNLGAEVAATAVQPQTVTEDVDGAIVVEPGCCWSLEAVAAAGSSPLMTFGVVWEEVPIV